MTQAVQVIDLDAALTLRSDDSSGGLLVSPPLSLSNAALASPPERGVPFGGYMAAAAVKSARQTLEVDLPLRTLSVQFVAGSRFEPVSWEAEQLRGGRSTVFAGVKARQEQRLVLSGSATFGANGAGPTWRPLDCPIPTPLDAATSTELDAQYAPWFTRYVDYRFVDLAAFGKADRAEVKTWLRVKGGGPLDDIKLAFLMDAVFPNHWMTTGPALSATVDLRYDLLADLTPESSPDGWAWFEFESRDCGDGWAVEDGVVRTPDGRPLALARQLRKIVSRRT
jgi:acyl-CoA thioesterase